MDKNNCKEYCNCAAEAMNRGASRDWVDGTQDNCPLRPVENKTKNQIDREIIDLVFPPEKEFTFEQLCWAMEEAYSSGLKGDRLEKSEIIRLMKLKYKQ